MRWTKKLLLPLLVVSLSLLLSVFGFGKQVSATSRYITSLNVANTTISNVGANNYFNFTLENVGINDNNTLAQLSLGVTFNNTLRSNKENGILLDFYVRVYQGDVESSGIRSNLFAVPVCPDTNVNMYQSNYAVAECTVEFLDYESFGRQYHELWKNSGSGTNIYTDPDTYGAIFNEHDYFFHYKIYAYNNSDDFVSTTGFNLYGHFLKVFDANKKLRTTGVQIITNSAIDGFPINRKSADEKMNDKDDQDRADLENQSSETDSDANSAGADASNTGTTLLGVFSAFVSALATIHETNCRLPSMSVYGLQLGQMDLCTFDVPPGIIALATVGMVFIIVPLSFHLARRLVNIFRSFQG